MKSRTTTTTDRRCFSAAGWALVAVALGPHGCSGRAPPPLWPEPPPPTLAEPIGIEPPARSPEANPDGIPVPDHIPRGRGDSPAEAADPADAVPTTHRKEPAS